MFSSPSVLTILLGASACLGTPTRRQASIPSYVLQYAPISHLYSGESWWPADVATHLTHTKPQVDRADIASSVDFNSIGSLASNVYLTSLDDVATMPSWLNGVKPDSSGLTQAPATIIVVDKPGGITDAFYFYFYSYDHAEYLDLQFGDHVGDWEHSMVRFTNGAPSYIYLSAHDGGSAYTYNALPNMNGRAVTYIATGTHANYATPGDHQHDIPFLEDHTDAGLLWDVTKNYRGYIFDTASKTFTIANGAFTGGSEEGGEGVGWLNFPGHWGDEQYNSKDGQYCIFSECKYVDGPTGPIAKNLGRTQVCQDESKCTVKTSV